MKLFVFGLGYTAQAFIRSGLPWSRVAGTVRSAGKAQSLRRDGIVALSLEEASDAEIAAEIGRADALLVCAPPTEAGDPLLARFREPLVRASGLAWTGYLSTTGVYGDRGGAWTDETVPANPQSPGSRRRHEAEEAWLGLGRETGRAVQVFRLAGIYGPERNALANLARGRAQRIVKPGQVFNRIHVDDIAAILAASLARPRGAGIYNVSDDEPSPPQDVVTYAAALAGVEAPPEIPFEDADLSPAARGFYAENKRIANGLIKRELGVRLRYPTYREGLDALYAAGEFQLA